MYAKNRSNVALFTSRDLWILEVPFKRLNCDSFYLQPAEKQLAATTTDLTSNNPMRLLPIMAVLIAIVFLLVIIAVVIIIVMRGRRRPGKLLFFFKLFIFGSFFAGNTITVTFEETLNKIFTLTSFIPVLVRKICCHVLFNRHITKKVLKFLLANLTICSPNCFKKLSERQWGHISFFKTFLYINYLYTIIFDVRWKTLDKSPLKIQWSNERGSGGQVANKFTLYSDDVSLNLVDV